METTTTQETLNDLILISNDRIEGYEKAIAELKDEDHDLKDIFSDMIKQSHQNKSEIVQELQTINDVPLDGTTTSGKIYRAWMDVRAFFSNFDRKAILSNCEAGEDAAQKAYEQALEVENLAPGARSIIIRQKASLKVSHDKIKALRDRVLS